MHDSARDSFGVGGWQVEPGLNLISRDGVAISLRPRVIDLLVYLSARAGEVVSVGEIIEKVWGGVFVTNGAIYNCINELRDAFGDSKDKPEYIETIAKRGYRLIAPTTNIAISPDPATGAIEASIAVLPFVNMSSDPEQEYFSDGISEEILNMLAKTRNLQVPARSLSFQFKGDNRDVTEIGRTLNVAHVLEGSVRKSGNQMRITAQLIDAGSGFHLWSDIYDRELTDIFAVQDDIATAIVDALKDRLGFQVAVLRQAPPVNIDAHDACLRGKYLVKQRLGAPNEAAVREFEKAVAYEPDYALAHAELAIAIRLLDRNLYGDLTQSETVSRAAPHAARALTLDPELAEAHAAQAYVDWGSGLLEKALAGFRRAIEVNPDYSVAYTWMGVLLGNDIGRWAGRDLGRYEEAFAAHQKSIKLDPLSIPANSTYISALITRKLLDEADREIEKFASFADLACSLSKKARRTSLGGKWANAILANLQALSDESDFVWARNYMTLEFATLGLGEEALAISESPLPLVCSLLGRPEEAVRLAEERIKEEPDSDLAKRDLGLALAGVGDYVGARPILEDIWSRNGGRVTLYGRFTCDNAAALIAIRRNAEDHAGVEEVLAALRNDVQRFRAAGIAQPSVDFWEGLAEFHSGNRASGMALIGNAADEGYFIWPKEAYLQALYDDPSFAPIRAAQEARQMSERDRFLAIVCTDNPYAPVWQPANETCELFSATGGN